MKFKIGDLVKYKDCQSKYPDDDVFIVTYDTIIDCEYPLSKKDKYDIICGNYKGINATFAYSKELEYCGFATMFSMFLKKESR